MRHWSGRLAGQLGQIALGLPQLRGDAFAVSGQQPSGRGQGHLPAGAVDEAGAGFPFQGQQLLETAGGLRCSVSAAAATLPCAATA